MRHAALAAGATAELLSTAESTAMIVFILRGADLRNVLRALSQLPAQMAAWVQSLGLDPLLVCFPILSLARVRLIE